MTRATGQRRGHGEDSVYFDEDRNRFVGAVSLGASPDGKRVRRKVTGKTKQEVRDKLKALHTDIDAAVQTPARHTVQARVDAWLTEGLSGRSARTVALYRDGVKPLTDKLGAMPLRKMTAANVRSALNSLNEQLSTRSLQIAHNCLVRAIRHAQADVIVARNVAELVRPPAGRRGRPSKALTVDQAQSLIDAAAGHRGDGSPYRLHAYVVLLLTTGIRPEEARALPWDQIDLDAGTVARLAVRPSRRRHQDAQLTPHPQTARDRLDRAARAQGRPVSRPPEGGGAVARQRPCRHHDGRDHAGPAQHPPRVPPDHPRRGVG